MTSEEKTASTNPQPSTTTLVVDNNEPPPPALTSSPEQDQSKTENESPSSSSSKDECCGVPKKRCVVVWTVFGLVSILFLTSLIVFCYYFFQPGPRRLECACDRQGDGCKALSRYTKDQAKNNKISPIYGTAKCKPGEECYVRYKDRDNQPRISCKKNPNNYICKKGQNTTECWCDTSLCFDNKVLGDNDGSFGCDKRCKGVGKGQVKKKPGY